MLKVYVTGLIYFNGCKEEVKRAYAPDGRDFDPPHQASLWIATDLVDEDATQWWDGFMIPRVVNDTPVIEFRIPNPAEITFPDVGNAVSCDDLDNNLPKLKKKKNGKEKPFDVNPATAQAIAEVTIHGGYIGPRRFKNIGLVEWEISNPSGREITTVMKNNPSDSGTITLTDAEETEVVFSNIHNPFEVDEKGEDAHKGNHVPLFIKLSPEAGVTVVSQKAPGNVGQLKTDNPILILMRKNAHIEGDTPGCCKP